MFKPQLNQVIIVGSGIVGAYTAVKLRKALPKLEIVILEAGNEHPAPSTKKQVHSDLFYDWSLTEGLGGNSNLWGGLLAKADQLGFEKFKVKGFDAYDDLLHHYDNVSKTLGWHNFDATKVSPEDVVIKAFCRPNVLLNASMILSKLNVKVILNAKVREISALKGKTVLCLEDGRSINALGPVFLACNAFENIRLSCSALKIDTLETDYINHSKGKIASFSSDVTSQKISDFIGYIEHGISKFHGIILADDVIRQSVFRVEPDYPWTDNQFLTNTLALLLNVKAVVYSLHKRSARRRIVSLGNVEYEDQKVNKFKLKDLFTFFLYFLVRSNVIHYKPKRYRLLCYYEHLGALKVGRDKFGSAYNLRVVDYKYKLEKITQAACKLIETSWFQQTFAPKQIKYEQDTTFIRWDSSHHAATTHKITNGESRLDDTNVWVFGASELKCLYGSNPTFSALAHADKILESFIRRIARGPTD